MDWSSFVLGIAAAFVLSTVLALALAACWPDEERDDLP
jgi:hypothetical protein